MYFHTFSLLLSVVPLALGYPAPAVLPSPVEAVLLLMLASCSFVANLLVSRALQIEMAAKATAINFTQARGCLGPSHRCAEAPAAPIRCNSLRHMKEQAQRARAFQW
jgi:hypothetical protein